VAWALCTADHAWSVRYSHSPNGYGSAIRELCVSGQEIWIRRKINTLCGTDEFVTERFRLRAIALVDLLKQTEVKLPALIQRSTLKEYEKRLRAVHDAEHVNEPISESMCRLEAAVPDEYLALTDRLLGKRQEYFYLQVENDKPQATHS
jgi:hypothetical protein